MTAFLFLQIASLVALALALCATFMLGLVAPGVPISPRAPRRRPLLLGFVSLAIPIALLGALLLVVRALLD